MGPDKIVLVTPGVERMLDLGTVPPLAGSNEFPVKGSMKALIFAKGLGVVRATMKHPNAQTQKPKGQRGVRMF